MAIRSVVLVVLLVTGCGFAPSAAELPDDAIIVYEFHDSSVPPPYHRSITLTASREEARIVVDSYGDVLADVTAPTPAEAWSQLASSIGLVSDAVVVAPPSGGCTGGTSVDLTVTSGSNRIVELSPEFCAGSNQLLDDAIDEWIAPIRELFGPMDELAPEQP